MISLQLPLSIGPEGLAREEDVRKSISSFLRLLLTSQSGLSADRNFGFLLNNLTFENFDEDEGVVTGRSGVYGKKISGSSINLNTFASELQSIVVKYERRLQNVSATMEYDKRSRVINVTISGVIKGSEEKYQYDSRIQVWK
ncbi:MAG: hypothetical protein MJY45_07245 [Bacteroidales bacterium]|nr:hypothetical protein [Bacteroidales bacterium]